MNYISKYSELENISEATLDDTKIDVDYIPSRRGRDVLDRFGITENLKLSQTGSVPKLTELVLQIRQSSMKLIEFGDLIKINNIEDISSQLFIYETTSRNFPYAVAVKGIKTTMLKQANRTGASARGNYFRETAFIITFAIRLWEKNGVKIDIYSNRGKIKLDFKSNSNANENDRKATMSNSERAEFRNEYNTFMSNTRVNNSMIEQIDKLIIKLGNSIYNINYVVKNSSELLINRVAQDYLKEEEDRFSELSSNSINIKDFGTFNVPQGVTMPKWNPSDIWIMYKGSDWILSNDKKSSLQKKDSYELHNIEDLESLNVFLHTCVMKRDGIVGVSLKQQLDGPHDTYEVNLDPNARFFHTYTGYYAKDSIKSVKLKFSYKTFNGKDGLGEIDIRTFDTDKKSNISMEVKGSISSGHMSGKAGTYIKFVMPPDRYRILEFIRKNEVEDIKGYLNNIRYVFAEDDLKVIFEKDLESPKNGQSNSRMQAIIFTDWLESLDSKSKSKIVSDIVRFAKSESSWSAAHLLSK
jgi:hypothetical protein